MEFITQITIDNTEQYHYLIEKSFPTSLLL